MHHRLKGYAFAIDDYEGWKHKESLQKLHLWKGRGRGEMSRLGSWSDPNSGSEPGLGRETIYWDSLPALSDIGVSKSYNCINMLYTKIQNKTTTIVVFTVSYT